MTDTAEAGSVVLEAPAGNPAQPTPPVDNGSAAGSAKSWFDGLSEGNRKLAETKGWTTPESLDKAFTSYAELERMQGESLRVPAPDAPKEEWEKFHSKLPEDMRPVSSPDTLTYKLPEGLPEGLPYSEDLATASKQWAVADGLTAKQAQSQHDKFVGYMAEQVTAQQAAIAQSVEQTYDDLVKDFGPADSESFKTKLTLVERATKALGLTDVFKAKGIILPDGSLTDPQVARAMLAVGEKQFSEDTIGSNDTPIAGNPFKRLSDGTRDVTAITALVKSDPERAKRMAREAGENPELWVSSNPL